MCAVVALRREAPEPLVVHSLGSAAPGSPVHRMQAAIRAGRARFEAVLAAEGQPDDAAAEDGPEATGAGPQLRRSVPAVGSAAAAGLRPVSDAVRPSYGGGTARAGRDASPLAPGVQRQAPVSLGTLSTDEGAVRTQQNPAPAPVAAAPEPEVVVEQETVIIAPAEAVPAATCTAQKVQPVVVCMTLREACSESSKPNVCTSQVHVHARACAIHGSMSTVAPRHSIDFRHWKCVDVAFTAAAGHGGSSSDADGRRGGAGSAAGGSAAVQDAIRGAHEGRGSAHTVRVSSGSPACQL